MGEQKLGRSVRYSKKQFGQVTVKRKKICQVACKKENLHEKGRQVGDTKVRQKVDKKVD